MKKTVVLNVEMTEHQAEEIGAFLNGFLYTNESRACTTDVFREMFNQIVKQLGKKSAKKFSDDLKLLEKYLPELENGSKPLALSIQRISKDAKKNV